MINNNYLNGFYNQLHKYEKRNQPVKQNNNSTKRTTKK